MEPHDLAWLSAGVNACAALGVLYLMVAVTAAAGLGSRVAAVKLLHRLLLGALSVALVANAGVTLVEESAPRPLDLVVQILFLLAVAVAAARQNMAGAAYRAVEQP